MMFVVWQRQALSEYCIQMRKEASCRAEGRGYTPALRGSYLI